MTVRRGGVDVEEPRTILILWSDWGTTRSGQMKVRCPCCDKITLLKHGTLEQLATVEKNRKLGFKFHLTTTCRCFKKQYVELEFFNFNWERFMPGGDCCNKALTPRVKAELTRFKRPPQTQ